MIDVLRSIRPPRLYVAMDAPHPDRPGEAKAAAEVKKILDGIDWPCEVRRNYAEKNLGSGGRVPTAVTWMLEQENEGIILEDDCLPDPTFFRFCQEMLDRFRDDERVMGVSGQLGQPGHANHKESYFFSKYTRTWGWATWRRAWTLYEHDLAVCQRYQASAEFRARCFDEQEALYWRKMLELTDAWDYRWVMTSWRRGGLVAVSTTNLVCNLGFRDDATHTWPETHGHLRHDAEEIGFPLVPAPQVKQHEALDRFFWDATLRPPGIPQRIKRKIRRIFRQFRQCVAKARRASP
jgi:hypothetical protein